MAESNLKEMMVEDVEEDGLEDHDGSHSVGNTIPVYMLNSYGTFCNVFNFFITLLLIYDHFAVPILLVFPGVYQTKDPESGEWYTDSNDKTQKNLKSIEMFIDVFILIDIIANFFKWSRATKTLATIADNYIRSGNFFFDVAATLPGICNHQNYNTYFLKSFRLVHFFRITKPLEILLDILLAKFSKKRQNDLTSFCCLILYVIYISHVLACVWL